MVMAMIFNIIYQMIFHMCYIFDKCDITVLCCLHCNGVSFMWLAKLFEKFLLFIYGNGESITTKNNDKETNKCGIADINYNFSFHSHQLNN